MKKRIQVGPKVFLRAERLRYEWSQQELADRIGISVVTINRWERGVTSPSPYFRLKLCALFKKSASELGLLPAENAGSVSPSVSFDEKVSASLSSLSVNLLWFLPFRRNSFFTGRENILAHLHLVLHRSAMRVYALCGLGGIGKTQVALEYAYRFRNDYQAIFWIRAETAESLVADCLALARYLHLSGYAELRQEQAIDAIKSWLGEHQHWLLIMDVVEDMALVDVLLPSFLTGCVLVTTRVQATSSRALQIKLAEMTQEESCLLLLRRARYLLPSAVLKTLSAEVLDVANTLSKLLDGMPLALDQAGAYIEETGCSLPDYLERYLQHRKALLNRRGSDALQHPASVAATILLCVEHVEQQSAGAAELLRCCAFLHAESISEQFLITSASALGPMLEYVMSNPLERDGALASLRAFSLLQRSTTSRRLLVHRLVQAVLRDTMETKTKQLWVERIVRAVHFAFPAEITLESMRQCEQLLAQLDLCARFIAHWKLFFPEAGQLLQKAGHYLLLRGQYKRAEAFLSDALKIFQQGLDTEDLAQIAILNDLGIAYEEQGKYVQAEAAYQRALSLREKFYVPDHPDLTEILGNVGRLALRLGHHEQAEVLFLHTVSLQEQIMGVEHLDLVPTLSLMANLHQQQGRYEQAEAVLWRAVGICQQKLGETHPLTIEGQSKIAILYSMQGRSSQAAELAAQVIDTLSRDSNGSYYQTTSSLCSLGLLYSLQEKHSQAEALLRQAVAICQRTFGYYHPETAESIRNLALIYKKQGNYKQAVFLLEQAKEIFITVYSFFHPDVAECQSMLGTIYSLQASYILAEGSLQQAIEIFSAIFGSSHPHVIDCQSALDAIPSYVSGADEADE